MSAILILFVLFASIVVVLFVELKFSKLWNRVYFRSGISIFLREISVSNTSSLKNINLSDFKHEFSNGDFHKMEFKILSDTEIAFRESFDQPKSNLNNQILHGMIELEEGIKIVVRGRLNWYAILFPIVFISFIFIIPIEGDFFYEKLLSSVTMLFIFVFLCFLQRNRYEKVFAKIMRLYTSR